MIFATSNINFSNSRKEYDFLKYFEFAEEYAFFNQKDHLLEKLEWNNFYKILKMKYKQKTTTLL